MNNENIRKPEKYIGAVSAILCVIFTIWFFGAFGAYMSNVPQWENIEQFIESIDMTLYVLWVVPCLLLAVTYVIFISTIYHTSNEKHKLWGLLGMVFGVMYGVVLGANYFVLLTGIKSGITAGNTEGLSWFLVGSPNSITSSLEGIGYGLMGLSMLFAGFSFGKAKMEVIIKFIFILNGVAGFIGVVLGVLGSELATYISLGIWGITFPIALILTAIRFFNI